MLQTAQFKLTNNTEEKITDLTVNKMFKRALLNEHVPKTCSAKHVPPNKKCVVVFLEIINISIKTGIDISIECEQSWTDERDLSYMIQRNTFSLFFLFGGRKNTSL